MKRFLLVSIFLLSSSLFAQSTINFETVGNGWAWNIFSQGTNGSFDIVANPSSGGLNTTDSTAKLFVDANGDPWAGVWCSDFPDLTLSDQNCMVKVLVYKDVISPFNLKLEPPNVDHKVSNTVINQWEELTFDYSSDIGVTSATLTIIPDFPDSRTYSSTNYFDEIRFTPLNVPVELTSFTGSFVGGTVQLKWSTATELNNRGFEIQRSGDGSKFTSIAFVNGNGTSTEKHQYSYTDKNLERRVNYAYRLKQVDFDGTTDYSAPVNLGQLVPVEFSIEQNYPNPFNPTTSIGYAVPVKSDVTLQVFNLIGQKVATLVQSEVEAGEHTVQFNASSLPSGIYLANFIAVGQNGSRFTSSKKMTLLK